MEQVIQARIAEQEIINEIKSEFEVVTICNEQANLARELWKEVFPEVSERFLDYYFAYRAKENIMFAVQGDELYSMLHLSPCSSAMRRNPPLPGANRLPCMADVVRVDANFISMAVTKEGYRKRGYMKRLLSSAFEYQRRMHIPFCMVAAEADTFFEQFGFHYIYDKPQYELNTEVISEEMLRKAAGGETVCLDGIDTVLTVADRGSLLSLAHFVNANLCKHYGVFHIRSAVYYERFQRELQSLGGELYQIVEHGKLKGYFAYVAENGGCIREVVFENEPDLEQYFYMAKEQIPTAMARIVNLPDMLRHISSNGKVTVAIRLIDSMIAENDGLFIWYIDEYGSRMERVEEPENGDEPSMRPEVTATIGEFTAFIFEYIKLKQNLKFDSIYLSGPAFFFTM